MNSSPSNYLRWMSPTIGDTFPDLRGETQHTDKFSLYEYLGDNSWGVVFLHPGDFTPVCTTELGAAQSLTAEFYARNAKICGFSCDDAASHRAWIADIEAATGHLIEFPMFCDPDRKHAIELGVFDPVLKDRVGLPQTVRAVFILDPSKKIALTMTYPSNVGRNFDEILRVLDALQRDANYSVFTPANWQPGDRTIVPYGMNDDEATEKFGKNGYIIADLPSERGRDIDKHYLRYTDDPILIDIESKQASKIASRIGRIKSWKPPKSFLPAKGTFSISKLRKPKGTVASTKFQTTPVRSEGPARSNVMEVDKNEHLNGSEHGKEEVTRNRSKKATWTHVIVQSFSGLKSEMGSTVRT